MISAIFAVDDNGGIGNDGKMPWPPNKDDFKWFKEKTIDQVVVMGRSTWDSIDMPKPLSRRINVVVTNNPATILKAIPISGNIPDLLKKFDNTFIDKEIIVIGGANILMQSKPVLERIFITRIPGTHDANVHIDLPSLLEGFKLIDTRDLGSCKVEEYINEAIS